jgi:cell wall assembly regulator SMI1
VKETWDRLEAFARKQKRSLDLRKGVKEKSIAAAEKKMKLKFPADLRASMLAHDGQEGSEEDCFEWLPGCSPLKPLEQIVERWQEEKDDLAAGDGDVSDDGLVHTVLWHPKRIPIAGTQWWDGDNTYVDLHPGPKGTVGQITTFTSECDLDVLGPSLSGALDLYLDALESGEWIYEKKTGRVGLKGNKDPGNASYEFAEWITNLTKKQKKKKKKK